MCPFFSVKDCNYFRNPEIPDCTTSLFLSIQELPYDQPSTPKRPAKHLQYYCMHRLVLFQKIFMKEMEEIKQFTKSTEQMLEELEMALLNISGKNNVNYKENSPFLLELLKNCIPSLEKELIGKHAIISFLLKQKSESDISLIDNIAVKTVTETIENIESKKIETEIPW